MTSKGIPELGPVLGTVPLVCWPHAGPRVDGLGSTISSHVKSSQPTVAKPGETTPDKQVNPGTRQFTVIDLVTPLPNWCLHSLPISAGRPQTGDRRVTCGR